MHRKEVKYIHICMSEQLRHRRVTLDAESVPVPSDIMKEYLHPRYQMMTVGLNTGNLP